VHRWQNACRFLFRCAGDESTGADKEKTDSPSSTPSADDADATKKPSPDF
jgi:hypothetical protein